MLCSDFYMEQNRLEKKEIGVIGLGAIGGIMAAFMKKAGYSIEVAAKYEDYAELVETEGVSVIGIKGKHKVKIPAVPRAKDFTGKKDIIFLAVKATDMMDIAPDMKEKLKESGRVVTLQNGITQPKLGEIIDPKKIIACVIGFGGTIHGKGKVEVTSKGEFVIGTINNREDPQLKAIKTLLDTTYPTYISENMIGYLYAKLIINSCITSLGAICGLYLGEMLKKKKVREIFIKIMEEAIDVADAMGIKVEPYADRLDYYSFLKDGFFARIKRHLTIRVIGFKYRKIKSSSLQSLERGKPTEVDYLNGYIIEQGEKHGVKTPVNDKVVEIIKEIEDEKRKISPKNFEEFDPLI